MQQVRRFADPEYAKLSLAMRDGGHADAVFDRLLARGQVVLHASESERTASLATLVADGALIVADTREHVATLNAAIRDDHGRDTGAVATHRGELIGPGDRVVMRSAPSTGTARPPHVLRPHASPSRSTGRRLRSRPESASDKPIRPTT